MSHVVVVVGGGALSPRAVAAVPDGALILAADSGLDHAVEAGLAPTVLIGDLDSISAAGRMWAYANGVDIDEHPTDKDATDTELALQSASASERDHLLLLGGPGDRLDHTLGTISALGHPLLAGFASITAWLGDTQVLVLHPDRAVAVAAPVGATFSLLALHGPCTGVQVHGGRWPLHDASLSPGDTLGISNEVHEPLRIGVAGGVLTVVLP